MNRRIPLFSTFVVLASAATMVSLGVWQLHRKEWKEALIARYEKVEGDPVEIAWPAFPSDYGDALYHRSSIDCPKVIGFDAYAGESARGQSGWAHIAHCLMREGDTADVALGWSNAPAAPQWAGGHVTGIIAQSGDSVRLVAEPAQAGLAQLARPDPRNLPNNHLSYAVQWFLFALTALVIYALALRKRWRGEAGS